MKRPADSTAVWRLRHHETQSSPTQDMDLDEAWTWFWGQIARTLSGCLTKVLLGFQTMLPSRLAL